MQPAIHRDDLSGGFGEFFRDQQAVGLSLIRRGDRGTGQCAVGVELGEFGCEGFRGLVVGVWDAIFSQGTDDTVAGEHGTALNNGGRGHAIDAHERREFLSRRACRTD